MFMHSEITHAHKDAVMSVVMAADCIYTASRDKTLKRQWKVNVAGTGKFELQPELEVPLGDVCWCLISAGDWLFCGLGDGLMTHQHVLLSGASDGAVRCWQMNPHTTNFECNANGDFYLHNLYAPDGDGGAVVKDGNTFHIATSGDDGNCKIISIECEELSNPSYEEPSDPPQGAEAVFHFFFKGAGIPRAPKKKKTETNEEGQDEALKQDDADVEAAMLGEEDFDEMEMEMDDDESEIENQYVHLPSLDHLTGCLGVVAADGDQIHPGAPIICRLLSICRGLRYKEGDRVRWVTATHAEESRGVWLWSGEGKLLMQLSLNMPIYKHVAFNRLLGEWEPKEKKEGKASGELLSLSAAWKKNGTVIFASTDVGAEKYVAVWAIDKNGMVGKIEEEDDGSTRIQYSEPSKFDAADGASHFFSSKGLTYAPPLAIYEQPGVLMDIDKQIEGTAFVTDVRQDFDLAMWNIEAAPKNSMLVMPQDPANLLIMPGRERVELIMTHKSKVIDTQVVEDSEGPAVVVGCDDGAVYAWDLGGHDKGQIYAEMRSLSPMEVFLPPFLLIVSALQMVSFAFGPAIPWKKTVKQPAVVTHQVKIDKAMIFWPEMIAVLSFILLFAFSAFTGLPSTADGYCRSIQNSKQFRDEMETGPGCQGPMKRESQCNTVFFLQVDHAGEKLAKTFTFLVYLLMQLLSTALVAELPLRAAVRAALPDPDLLEDHVPLRGGNGGATKGRPGNRGPLRQLGLDSVSAVFLKGHLSELFGSRVAGVLDGQMSTLADLIGTLCGDQRPAVAQKAACEEYTARLAEDNDWPKLQELWTKHHHLIEMVWETSWFVFFGPPAWLALLMAVLGFWLQWLGDRLLRGAAAYVLLAVLQHVVHWTVAKLILTYDLCYGELTAAGWRAKGPSAVILVEGQGSNSNIFHQFSKFSGFAGYGLDEL
eukprot:Skav211471  [mRNA]  locus=scaffold1118:57574:78397:- [translate_table: standard]